MPMRPLRLINNLIGRISTGWNRNASPGLAPSTTTILRPSLPLQSDSHSQPNNNFKPHPHPPSVPDLAQTLLTSRLEKLPPDESVEAVFQGWMRDGFRVDRGGILQAVGCLRRCQLNSRALEVMEWVMRERPYELTELDYSYLLEFTGKCRGITNAQKLFITVPESYRSGSLDGLVLSCLDEHFIKHSFMYMQQMRELSVPISLAVYHKLITVHLTPSRRDKIPDIVRQMKADGVKPQVSTFNTILDMYASDHDICELAKVFDEMQRAGVEPNESTYCILAKAYVMARLHSAAETYVEAIERSKMGNMYRLLDVLIMLYGCLNKDRELDQTWRLVQQLPHIEPKSYCLAIEAFGKVRSVSRAEKIWAKLKNSKKIDQTFEFNSILSVYCRHGRIKKAIGIFKEMAENKCKPNAITYRHLALGYLKAGRVKGAIKMIKTGKGKPLTTRVMRSISWLETTLMVVEMFCHLGKLEYAELVFKDLKKAKYSRHAFVYNALLKGYVTAKVHLPDLLERMILDGTQPDAESHSLLNQIEQYKRRY